MDQGKVRAAILIGSVLLLAADKPAALPLSDARWLAAGAPVTRLLSEPGECIEWPAAPPMWRSAKIGRIAFRAPLLLGGQAARAGLSCASCHRNGRGNPDFHFPGISGEPGTADVTASLLSSHRGDGAFNPKPIPDLAQPGKVSRDRRKADLRTFIRGLIVEEFDGPEPPPAVLQGLIDYVRFMDARKCGSEVAITLESALKDVKLAFDLAQEEAIWGDRGTVGVMLGAARSELGRVDERFSVAGLEAERAVLRDASGELGALQQSQESGTGPTWRRWDSRWPDRETRLLRAESRSLYSADVLRRRTASRD